MTPLRIVPAALVALGLAVPAAGATLVASPQVFGLGQPSGFSIGFDDSSGDGLLQFDEITGFSGVTVALPIQFDPSGNPIWVELFLAAVRNVPDIGDVSTVSAAGGVTPGSASWSFQETAGDGYLVSFPRESFSYLLQTGPAGGPGDIAVPPVLPTSGVVIEFVAPDGGTGKFTLTPVPLPGALPLLLAALAGLAALRVRTA